jgi:hypothetical protein
MSKKKKQTNKQRKHKKKYKSKPKRKRKERTMNQEKIGQMEICQGSKEENGEWES